MSKIVISGTGLYQPPHVITNAELVEAFNAYADLQNSRNAAEIAARHRRRADPTRASSSSKRPPASSSVM